MYQFSLAGCAGCVGSAGPLDLAALLWLAKCYAIPASMYASLIWGTRFMKKCRKSSQSESYLSRRGICDGKSVIHPRNLWVRGSNLTGGSQLAKLPSFGGYSLETLTAHEEGQ